MGMQYLTAALSKPMPCGCSGTPTDLLANVEEGGIVSLDQLAGFFPSAQEPLDLRQYSSGDELSQGARCLQQGQHRQRERAALLGLLSGRGHAVRKTLPETRALLGCWAVWLLGEAEGASGGSGVAWPC